MYVPAVIDLSFWLSYLSRLNVIDYYKIKLLNKNPKMEDAGTVTSDAGFIFIYSPNKTDFNVCSKTLTVIPPVSPEPTTTTLPTLYLQILMMMVATGFLQLLLKPFYQQRLTAALIVRNFSLCFHMYIYIYIFVRT